MILDHELLLITAGVDGELPPADTRRLERLLAESAEARTLFVQLQHDRTRVANLPKQQTPAGLRDRILAQLAYLPPHTAPVVEPAPAPVPVVSPRRRRWVPVAVAAAIYFVLAGGSLFFFTRGDNQAAKRQGASTVKGGVNPAPFLPPDDQNPSTPVLLEPPERLAVRAGRTPTPTPSPEMGPNLPENRSPQPATPPNLFAFPPLPPIAPLDAVQVRVPFLKTVAELEREDIRQQLLDELGRDPAYRFDLFTHDTVKAADAIQNIAKGQGVSLFVDAAAQDRIKRKQAGAFVIYTESLTAAELRDLFTKLAADDAKSPQHVFDSLHATPVTTVDQAEFKSVFGTTFDLGVGKRPQPAPIPAMGPDSKPISAGTADQLAKSLNKQTDKPAVVMSLTPTRTPPTNSKELAQYRERRGERRPNTIPVMIVIRQTHG